MNAIAVALLSIVCIFGGALLGLRIRSLLPDHHLSDASRDVVKLGAGLIATLAALVLGLLVSTAKGSLDTISTELTQLGARTILLDRVLADYGPETKEVREIIRSSLVTTIDRIWPEERTMKVNVRAFETSKNVEGIQGKLRILSPRSDSQRQLKSQALQLAAQTALSRWVIIEQIQQTLPTLFLVVLIFWLTMLFVGFGLLSPFNATVLAVLFVCAVSVSGAIFLILEMETPFSGIVKVSSATMQKTLDLLGR
jgi:hypothetical protein